MPNKKDQDEERAARLDQLVEEHRVEAERIRMRAADALASAKASVKKASAILAEVTRIKKAG